MAFVLQLFGGFHLVGEDGRSVPLPDRARALLAYLAVASSPVPRHVLAELLSAEVTNRSSVRHFARPSISLAGRWRTAP
jgi:DNA-binding SARP family transcriptional activator